MKRVIYLAYFFPPTGGAGVQRTLKFVRYLPEFGWQPTVITPRATAYWMQDRSLIAEVPSDVRVIRTQAWTGLSLLTRLTRGRGMGETNVRRSGKAQGFLRRVAGWLMVPDVYAGWVPFAARAAARALAGGGVLLTTSSPDSTHLVGLRLAHLGVPWVADFRDPWVRRMSFDPPTGIHRRIHKSMEARVVRTASRVIVTSEATRRDFLERYPDLDPAHVSYLPNGFDERDFPAEDPAPDPMFLLVHSGQLNPERPIGPLLDHIEALFALKPLARSRTRVELIGPRYREDEIEVERRALSDVVRFVDALPHRQSIERLLRARVLLLMEQESDRGSLILPGKTFEYLRTGRPIVGLLPRGAAWDLIASLRAGACALPSDAEAGAWALAGLFDAYCAGSPPVSIQDQAAIRGFERRSLAARLADLLDEVSGGRG